jgi:hypothetical protein
MRPFRWNKPPMPVIPAKPAIPRMVSGQGNGMPTSSPVMTTPMAL